VTFRTLRDTAVIRVLLMIFPLMALGLGEAQVLKATRQEYLRWSAGIVDIPEREEQRLASLRYVLPEYGSIGYVDPDQSWSDPAAIRAFYLTQYALAPRIIVYGAEPEYVIYSSHLGRPLPPDRIPEGMQVFSQIRPDLAVLIRLPR
jgi:hypothetical protein